MNNDDIPYSTLTPDLVLNAIDAEGWQTDGRLLALNSYENRVYQVGIEEHAPIVAKFYRPHRWSDNAILEEHAFVKELVEYEIPVVNALAFSTGDSLMEYQGFRYALYPKQGGRAPELIGKTMFEWIGRFIGRLHAVGSHQHYDYRPVLDINHFGYEPRDFLLEQDFIPFELIDAYRNVSEHALNNATACYERSGEISLIRLHGDCYPSNILWTDQGPHFVDFDDSRMGPAIQDLWMLLSGSRQEMTLQLNYLLEGYCMFFDFDHRQLQLIEALRTLRIINYAAWLARRWRDPAFPIAFPWFNKQRYWEDHILALREQIALMEEEPLLI